MIVKSLTPYLIPGISVAVSIVVEIIMSMVEREPSAREILVHIASKQTWLVPILYYIYSYGGLKLQELREIMGTRTRVVKRGLWWLTKYGVIERTGEKYVFNPEFREAFTKLIWMDYCVVGSRHLFKIGKTIFVVKVSPTRITSYTVPAGLLDKLKSLEENIEAKYTPLEASQALGIPLKLARRLTKVHNLLKECRTR